MEEVAVDHRGAEFDIIGLIVLGDEFDFVEAFQAGVLLRLDCLHLFLLQRLPLDPQDGQILEFYVH